MYFSYLTVWWVKLPTTHLERQYMPLIQAVNSSGWSTAELWAPRFSQGSLSNRVALAICPREAQKLWRQWTRLDGRAMAPNPCRLRQDMAVESRGWLRSREQRGRGWNLAQGWSMKLRQQKGDKGNGRRLAREKEREEGSMLQHCGSVSCKCSVSLRWVKFRWADRWMK